MNVSKNRCSSFVIFRIRSNSIAAKCASTKSGEFRRTRDAKRSVATFDVPVRGLTLPHKGSVPKAQEANLKTVFWNPTCYNNSTYNNSTSTPGLFVAAQHSLFRLCNPARQNTLDCASRRADAVRFVHAGLAALRTDAVSVEDGRWDLLVRQIHGDVFRRDYAGSLLALGGMGF